jgi:hypothetical protein
MSPFFEIALDISIDSSLSQRKLGISRKRKE